MSCRPRCARSTPCRARVHGVLVHNLPLAACQAPRPWPVKPDTQGGPLFYHTAALNRPTPLPLLLRARSIRRRPRPLGEQHHPHNSCPPPASDPARALRHRHGHGHKLGPRPGPPTPRAGAPRAPARPFPLLRTFAARLAPVPPLPPCRAARHHAKTGVCARALPRQPPAASPTPPTVEKALTLGAPHIHSSKHAPTQRPPTRRTPLAAALGPICVAHLCRSAWSPVVNARRRGRWGSVLGPGAGGVGHAMCVM